MRQIVKFITLIVINAVLVLGIGGHFGESTETKTAFLVAFVSLVIYFVCQEWEFLQVMFKYTFREESAEDEEEA